jgi:cytochrome c oxidase assembly protein subunit 15
MQPALQHDNLWLSRFAKLAVFGTVCLIFLGGMVTSLGAGLSVPDWPTSFGYNMFAFPIARWKGPIFWEHSHRLVASGIGMITVALAVWVWLAEKRPWVKRLALGALFLVCVQGLMGGLRVTKLSIVLAIIHGCTAQAFLCVLTLLALALSPAWNRPSTANGEGVASTKTTAWVLFGAVYLQLILGAIMRHWGAGLAIPTFPLTPEGTLFPTVHNAMIDIHFAHRAWAFVVALLAVGVVARALGSREASLQRPALLLGLLILIQITLGASIIWLQRAPIPTSLHVVNGAGVLVTTFLIAVRATKSTCHAAAR